MSRSTRVVTTRAELRTALGGTTGDVALVPTMGALHAGHAELMRTARSLTPGPVVVSIFVNPLQFAAGEDLDRYPRTFAADVALATAYDVDLVFAPGVAEVYPGGDPRVTVDPGPLGDVLEGAARPGHFRGVLTVVAKLLGLVRPDVAVFGEKDYQQLVLVRRMAADLCLGAEIAGVATVREPDGLARSSRNVFLTAPDRARAAVLSRALRAARDQAADGAGAAAAQAAAREVLGAEPAVEVDYLVVSDPDLGPPPETGAGRVLVAARVGGVRLLDNLPLELDPGSGSRSPGGLG